MSVRIGTWNLDHARAIRHDAARIRLLVDADADIWVLTETNDRVELPGYAAVHSALRSDTIPGGRWVSIWARLPIIKEVEVLDPNRSACALLASPMGDILVYGTVFPWQTDIGEPPATPRPAGWSEQYRVIPAQAEDWQRLRARFPSATLLVAGDLNLSLSGPHYYGTARGRALLDEAMASNGLACLTKFERVPAGMLQHPAIDHVLAPAPLLGRARVATAWEGRTEGGVRLSDHSAVVVDIG